MERRVVVRRFTGGSLRLQITRLWEARADALAKGSKCLLAAYL